VKGYTDLTNER